LQNVCKGTISKTAVKISKAGKLDFPAFAGTPGGIRTPDTRFRKPIKIFLLFIICLYLFQKTPKYQRFLGLLVLFLIVSLYHFWSATLAKCLQTKIKQSRSIDFLVSCFLEKIIVCG